jgi:hypothetical protein
LGSFRPGDPDAGGADFAAALRFANEDPELGRWLATQRAFDSGFATALERLAMPARLRQSILDHLAMERGDVPQAKDRFDALLVGLLATVHPPPALRAEILAAMDRSALRRGRRLVFWRRAMIPLAAAAGITLAFVATRGSGDPQMVKVPKLPVDVVEAEFIRAFESPEFTLDEKREDHLVLMRHLKERKLPCPGCLPKGLAKLKSIGCRELVIDGRVGSIICFDERENGIVHLVVFRRQDVQADLPDPNRPIISQNGKWIVARWTDHERVFVLIGDRTDAQRLAALF